MTCVAKAAFAGRPQGRDSFRSHATGESFRLVFSGTPAQDFGMRSLTRQSVLLTFIVCFLVGGNLIAAESSIIAAGAKLQKLAGDFVFTEGPACDAQGNVFFTDQPNDRILKWSTDGKLSTFMQPCG